MPYTKVDLASRRVIRKRGKKRAKKVSAFPPLTTLLGHLLRTVIQGVWSIPQGVISTDSIGSDRMDCGGVGVIDPPAYWIKADMDERYLFPGGWLDRYKGLFNEYKVHNIVAHYVPYSSFTSPGEYVFALWDCGQNASPRNFTDCIGIPSSVVRKSYQPAVLEWFPTEPEDKNWHTFGDKHVWCSSCVISAQAIYKDPIATEDPAGATLTERPNVAGKVTLDVTASFRGKSKKGTPGLHSPSDTSEYRLYCDLISCECRKCRKVFRRKALEVWRESVNDGKVKPKDSSSNQDWAQVSASNFG